MGQTNDRYSKKSTKSAPRFNDTKFIQYELSKEEKATCKSWVTTLEELDTLYLRFCESGYSMSAKWDDYSASFAAFGQTRDQKHANYGYMLTGRGSTPLKAMKQMLFKHYMIFDEMWAEFAESRSAYESDD
jgi:hypothetical protein